MPVEKAAVASPLRLVATVFSKSLDRCTPQQTLPSGIVDLLTSVQSPVPSGPKQVQDFSFALLRSWQSSGSFPFSSACPLDPSAMRSAVEAVSRDYSFSPFPWNIAST